jgi:uncharacterized protein
MTSEAAKSRGQALIEQLGLEPHPEGGHFRQIYRSISRVRPDDARSERASLTTIYYLHTAGEFSRWHSVRSDEVWHFYEGDPLELLVAPPDFSRVERHRLHAPTAGATPVAIVPANWWQAARPFGAYALTGCTVAPGFEFEDFQLLRDNRDACALFVRARPEFGGLV